MGPPVIYTASRIDLQSGDITKGRQSYSWPGVNRLADSGGLIYPEA